MLNIYFGEIQTGKLQRLAYLGWHVLLAVMVLLFGMAIGYFIGMLEQSMGGDLIDAQTKLRDAFGFPGAIAIYIILAGFLFAEGNIVAKRIRDIGFPGWWGVLVIIVIGFIASFAGDVVARIWSVITTLSLLFIPSGFLSKI